MEYIFTNLPQYIRVTSRSEFSSSVVHSGSVLLFSEDGESLTAKLPDGSFITVGGSGGTDVSDTTATAATVLSGAVFHDSTGAVTTGTIPTVSSATITPTTSNQIISSGVFLGGEQTILGDANLAGSNILSGVSIFGVPGELVVSGGAEVTLGYVTSGGQFQPLEFYGTMAFDSGSAVNLSCYQYNLPSGNISSGAIITSRAEVTVSSGWTYLSATVSSAWMVINEGGAAANTMLLYSGGLDVYSGGTALNTHAAGSNARIGNEGGFVSGIEMGSYTQLSVSSGGITTQVNARGYECMLYISSGYIGNATLNDGARCFLADTASNVAIGSGGYMEVSSGGTAIDITVSSGGTMRISTEAVTSNITSETGAVIINS